jgi:hypothetical protein
MATITIEKLALEVPGMSENEAQSLALAVADHLGTALLPLGADAPVVRVDLMGRSDATPSRLAARIVAEVTRQLLRAP